MSFQRFWLVFWSDLKYHLRRPLFISLLIILGLTAWGLTEGAVQISAGDSAVGGAKAWLTSEFSNAFVLSLLTMLYFGFFVSVGAGLVVISDEEHKVGEVLHATPLRVPEYIWGKFLAILATFLVALAFQQLASMAFLHLLPTDSADKIIGPFSLTNYVRPALLFALPAILFTAGVTFLLGEVTRKATVMFFFPVAMILLMIFFLWEWSPAWLDPRLNKALMALDPAGYRWFNETLIKLDLGVEHYNTQPVGYDALFLLSRAAFALIGIGCVYAAQLHFAKKLRGSYRVAPGAAPAPAATPHSLGHLDSAPLSEVGMKQSAPGWLSQVSTVLRFEFRSLVSSPGMYLFVPLILLQTIPSAYYRPGPMGTFEMITGGTFAAGVYAPLLVCVALLLLFYTVESLARERATGTWPIIHATPMRSGAWLTGKALANMFVAFVIFTAAFLGYLVLTGIQGKGRIELVPFAVVWGGIMAPSFFVWTTWVILLYALSKNKLATYALAILTMMAHGWAQNKGWVNWVSNWHLMGTVRWTDLGFLEPNAYPIFMNRVLWLSLGAFWIALTVKVYERREHDPTRTLHRLETRNLLREFVRLLPYVAVPAVLAIILGYQIADGPGGKRWENRSRDYWRQNFATYRDATLPTIVSVDADLRLEPEQNEFHLKGFYVIENIDEKPMEKILLTLGQHVEKATWTFNGEPHEPENRTNLFVFKPETPLAKGDRVTIGFEYGAKFPGGINRNGGGAGEFIMPSGAVIQGWSPSVFPVLGFVESIGVKGGENDMEPRIYPADHYKSQVKPAFGLRLPLTTRIRVDVPEEYMANSNGELIEEKVGGGRRSVLWGTDHPVMMFNVIAGKWAVRRGDGTAVYHYPGHDYNLDEMVVALDGARKYYSEWFYPFPWRELKLSQFANLAGYAQGFATNITFSESIGFLTRSTQKGRAAFTVAAHEAAHQWWGNILVPGEGPGGNVLSEGMAHYSTILLTQQLKGDEARMEFCKRIEETYGESRVVDSERPMVRVLGDKPGDTTIMYDKGGWVFYMMMNHMGRERFLAGVREFIAKWSVSADKPLLEDFVEHMRAHATDAEAYDAFTKQWFFEIVVPHYKLADVKKEQAGGKWALTGTITNQGTGTMPVEVAALSRKDRFPMQTEEEAAKGPAVQFEDYRDARSTVTLGAGESATFRIECDFEPKAATVDPDVQVLMLRRKNVAVDL